MEKEKPKIAWPLFFQALLILAVIQLPLFMWFGGLRSSKQDIDDWPFLVLMLGAVISYFLAGGSIGARTGKTYWYTCFAIGVISTIVGGAGRMTEIGFLSVMLWMVAAMALTTAGGWIGNRFFSK